MLTKKQFCKVFEDIHKLEKREEEFNEAFAKIGGEYSYIYDDAISALVDLLSVAMEVKDNGIKNEFCFDNDIEYFCYELDFGRADYADRAIEANGIAIDLSSPEKLYDYIVSEKLRKEKK